MRAMQGAIMLSVDNLSELIDILDYANGHPKLTDWEMEFVADMEERYIKYRGGITLSQRQVDVLNKIAAKLGIGA